MKINIETQLDYDMIETLAQELYRKDPTNPKLRHFLSMDNFEGAELRKSINR